MINPRPVWDFSDPAASEQRFAYLAERSPASERACWLTQVARAQGLQGRFDEAFALLESLSSDDHPEVAVRVALERGRLLRSSGDPATARPWFERTIALAEESGLEELELDGWHMLALVAPPAESNELHERAIARARAASDPAAHNWDASLLNNLGMNHADAGDFTRALPVFEAALAARTRIGDPETIRVARWMVAWTLRNLGRRDAALPFSAN